MVCGAREESCHFCAIMIAATYRCVRSFYASAVIDYAFSLSPMRVVYHFRVRACKFDTRVTDHHAQFSSEDDVVRAAASR